MITINQWVAIAALIATYALAYYLGKEVGYGIGYKAGQRRSMHNYYQRGLKYSKGQKP